MSGAFIQVRAEALKSALSDIDIGGYGRFLLYLMTRLEQLPLNSRNVLQLRDKHIAKSLQVSIRMAAYYKAQFIEAGILYKIPGQSYYLINQDIIYKGQVLKK